MVASKRFLTSVTNQAWKTLLIIQANIILGVTIQKFVRNMYICIIISVIYNELTSLAYGEGVFFQPNQVLIVTSTHYQRLHV